MSSVRGRGSIFICYRREETAAQAGRLYDRLSARFGKYRVFMDVDSIAFGVDFTEKVIEVLSGCDVFFALIGRNWSAITDSKGTRRVDNPDDWVRVEIETALERDIRVVPILVDGAELPQADDLPPSLRPLTPLQARELRHSSFQSDVTRLIAEVDAVIKRRQPSRLTATRIHAPAVDVPALAETLRLWYENQGLEAIMVAIPTALVVQCRAREGAQRVFGTNALLTVILQDEDEDLLVEIVSAKWLGTAAARAGLAPASRIFMPLALYVPTAGHLGMRKWQQHKLSNQTISFLRETAPTHVRGA
jgi:TIR domain